MTVCFLTRKYPPVVGGMERYSAELFAALPTAKKLVAVPQRHRVSIIWIAPWIFMRGLIASRGCTVLFLADGVLAPIGILLRVLTRKPVIAAVHGLELTYAFPFYGALVRSALKRLDRIVAVSQNTAHLAADVGIPRDRILVIPNGVTVPDERDESAVTKLRVALSLPTTRSLTILSIGRMTLRKGLAAFIRETLPKLRVSWTLIIAGTGSELQAIREAAEATQTTDNLRLLGAVDEGTKEALYDVADCFVMPNIPVDGDAEGFGIAAVEAAAHGLPVIASALEGITDAIHDGKNGMLVPYGDRDAFAARLSDVANDPDGARTFGEQAKRYTLDVFHWPKVAHRYVKVFTSLVP